MYINYFHYNLYWFYYIDELAPKKVYRPQDLFDFDTFPNDTDNYILLSNEILTHKEAKEKLLRLFPEYTLNKAILYHEAPRNKKGNGSRPKKSYYRRGNYIKESKKAVY